MVVVVVVDISVVVTGCFLAHPRRPCFIYLFLHPVKNGTRFSVVIVGYANLFLIASHHLPTDRDFCFCVLRDCQLASHRSDSVHIDDHVFHPQLCVFANWAHVHACGGGRRSSQLRRLLSLMMMMYFR